MMEYREAAAEDVKALQELALVSYGILKPKLTPENWTKMESVLRSDQTFPLLVKTCYGFVCETMAGSSAWPSSYPVETRQKFIPRIPVISAWWVFIPMQAERELPGHLTRLCIEKARASGEKKISLHSAEIMYAARHIYESEGFKKIKILDEHYGLVYWLYEMELNP